MARILQGRAERGSQKWIQSAVNERQDLLNHRIQEALGLAVLPAIQWVSPLEKDDYAEYSDQDALLKVGLDMPPELLTDFWPKRGPNWDALGVTDTGQIFLVEAKAHVDELKSACSAKEPSRAKIRRSLRETRDFLNVNPRCTHAWLRDFYQYANRLAHLYFLRGLSACDAYMLFVYFLDDREMGGPSTIEEWRGAIWLMESLLGVQGHKLSKYVGDVFVSVDELIDASAPSPANRA